MTAQRGDFERPAPHGRDVDPERASNPAPDLQPPADAARPLAPHPRRVETAARAMEGLTVRVIATKPGEPVGYWTGRLATGSARNLAYVALAADTGEAQQAVERHCPNCECIDPECGYVIGSAGCDDWHERNPS